VISPRELLLKTAVALPGFSPTELRPIVRGGSNRRFFRVYSENDRSVILVHDLGGKEENKQYGVIADFLGSQGIPVPAVLAAIDDEGLLWLEDLGEEDLWSSRNESWELRRPLYESVLRGIVKLHRIVPEVAEDEGLHLQMAFDERLYRWEQDYFAEQCLGGVFKIPEDKRKALMEDESLKDLARSLASLPRRLVHRDLQSQNILIRDGTAWFVDFQGMRPGLPQYDLASLLCDPYVQISSDERSYLLGFYRSLVDQSDVPSDETFERIFWQCASQRLMQALGAYGFLSIHCGKPAFLSHVSPALMGLRQALENLQHKDPLDGLATLVRDLDTKP